MGFEQTNKYTGGLSNLYISRDNMEIFSTFIHIALNKMYHFLEKVV
jgi:hypothetical protein